VVFFYLHLAETNSIMKKTFLLFGLALLAACSGDDSKTVNDGDILGTWRLNQEFVAGNEIDLNSCETQTTYTFGTSTVFIDESYQDNGGCDSDTSTISYSTSGSELTITNPNGGFTGGEFTVKYQVLSLTDSQLKLKEIYEVDGFEDDGSIPESQRTTRIFVKE